MEKPSWRRLIRICLSRGMIGSMLVLAGLLLASCGAESATSSSSSSVQLFSRIDYPQQIAVGQSDTVTLSFSINGNLLEATPVGGYGVSAPPPESLPSDPASYQDIGVSVSTTSTGNGPIVWQLTSAPRQSLLSTTDPHTYVSRLQFQWHAQALSAGTNQVGILLTVYYVYANGTERDGTTVVPASAIPMVAVQPDLFNTVLAQIKAPFAGATGLLGIVGVLRFLWNAMQTVQSTVETGEKIRKQIVRHRRHPDYEPVPPTLKRPRSNPPGT
jgi:hypothetical protein